jgi:hypothetical protein
MTGGDLEGCGPSQPLPARKSTPFHGADGADALQESASNAYKVLATMTGGDLEGCGPSQPLPARKSTPLHGADGADALQESASNAYKVLATMTGGDLEGRGFPRSRCRPQINTISRRRRSGRPPALRQH